MNTTALKLLTGSSLGAMGGALIAPKDERLSGAAQGTLWGTVAGGLGHAAGRGLVAKLKQGKQFTPAFKTALTGTKWKEPLTGAAMVTGITAVTNALTGAYNPDKNNKNKLLRNAAPAIDDLAMLGFALAKAADFNGLNKTAVDYSIIKNLAKNIKVKTMPTPDLGETIKALGVKMSNKELKSMKRLSGDYSKNPMTAMINANPIYNPFDNTINMTRRGGGFRPLAKLHESIERSTFHKFLKTDKGNRYMGDLSNALGKKLSTKNIHEELSIVSDIAAAGKNKKLMKRFEKVKEGPQYFWSHLSPSVVLKERNMLRGMTGKPSETKFSKTMLDLRNTEMSDIENKLKTKDYFTNPDTRFSRHAIKSIAKSLGYSY